MKLFSIHHLFTDGKDDVKKKKKMSPLSFTFTVKMVNVRYAGTFSMETTF